MSRTLGAFILVMGLSMGMPTNAGNPQSGDDQLRGSELPHGADLILLHGKIWTGEPVATPRVRETPCSSSTRMVEAVAIANGRILAVGSDEEIRTCKGLNTEVVDLRGRLVVPGLADSHVHFISRWLSASGGRLERRAQRGGVRAPHRGQGEHSTSRKVDAGRQLG